MKLFVSSGETLRFTLWNEPIRLTKAFALTGTTFPYRHGYHRMLLSRIGSGRKDKIERHLQDIL